MFVYAGGSSTWASTAGVLRVAQPRRRAGLGTYVAFKMKAREEEEREGGEEKEEKEGEKGEGKRGEKRGGDL